MKQRTVNCFAVYVQEWSSKTRLGRNSLKGFKRFWASSLIVDSFVKWFSCVQMQAFSMRAWMKQE